MNTRTLFNSLSVVGLSGEQVGALVNELTTESVETCVRNEILPNIGAYCHDYIDAISKRTTNVPVLYKFLAPTLFRTKLDDIPESKFAFSHYLSDTDCTYYLNDTNHYKVSLLFRSTKHRHRLVDLIPLLTIKTPRIVDVLCNYIYAGIDVKSLANQCAEILPNHLSMNLGILVFYTGKSHHLTGKTIELDIADLSHASSEYVRLYGLVRRHYEQQSLGIYPSMIFV